jgi:hypothetical protein
MFILSLALWRNAKKRGRGAKMAGGVSFALRNQYRHLDDPQHCVMRLT